MLILRYQTALYAVASLIPAAVFASCRHPQSRDSIYRVRQKCPKVLCYFLSSRLEFWRRILRTYFPLRPA